MDLVFTGDLADRGSDTRLIYDFLMGLEDQARVAGGRVHVLMGNHDYMNIAHPNEANPGPDERRLFHDGLNPKKNQINANFVKLMRGNSKYARWFRNRPTMIRIGDRLFVHGGLDVWALNHSPREINETVKAWIQFHQKVGPKPPEQTSWMVEIDGPFWTRDAANEFMDAALLNRILDRYEVKQLIVGHTTQYEGDVGFSYGGKVVLIDTGNSAAYGDNGKMSSIEILGDQVTPKYAERSKTSDPIRNRALGELREKNALRPILCGLRQLYSKKIAEKVGENRKVPRD